MRVARDKSKTTEDRGLIRFHIIASAEHRAGLLPSKRIRKDDAGQVFTTQTAALAYAKKLQGIIGAGNNPSTTVGRTFEDALKLLRADLEKREADDVGTAYHYDTIRSRLTNYIERLTIRDVPINDVQLSTIDYEAVESDLVPQIRNAKKLGTDKPVTKNFQRLLKQDVKEALSFAITAKWISHNPIAHVTFGSVQTKARERSGVDALAREVYQRLLASFDLHLEWARRLDPNAELPIHVAAKTGVRAGELLAISPNKIGHNTRQLLIDCAFKKVESRQPKIVGLPKSNKARVVGLPADLLNQVRQHQEENNIGNDELLFGATDHAPWRRAWQRAQFAVNGWLLLYSGSTSKAYRLFKLRGNETDAEIAKLRSWSDGQVGKAKNCKRDDGVVFNTLAEAAAHAGITLLTWHDLRHLYCSVLFHAELPIKRITELLGHANDDVTRKHYKEWITDPVRDANEADCVDAVFKAQRNVVEVAFG